MLITKEYFFFVLFSAFTFNYVSPKIFELHPIKNKGIISLRNLGMNVPLYGSSADLNYYYVYLYLGENSQRQSYIVDTGSSITTSPCKPYCKNCGKHENNYFTANDKQIVSCSNDFCKQVTSKCSSNQCGFSISYSEGSSLNGIYINTTAKLFEDSYAKTFNIPIGCTTRETNLFVTQFADGIMGLSNSDFNFITLLYKNKVIKHNIFSMCLSQEGGYLSVDDINAKFHKENIEYINSSQSGFYYINIESISIDDEKISLKNNNNYKYSSFIDSGTTIAYFPKILFDEIIKKFKAVCSKEENINKCGNYSIDRSLGPCYRFKNKEEMEYGIKYVWPSISFNINDKYIYTWKPEQYYFNDTDDNKYQACLGFQSDTRSTITLGSTWMHGHDIIFDRENKRIGFAEANCGMKSENEGKPSDIPTDPNSKPEEKTNEESTDESEAGLEEELDRKAALYNEMDCNQNSTNKSTTTWLIIYSLSCTVLIVLIIICGFAIYKLKKGESFLCFKFNPAALGYNNNIGTMEGIESIGIENKENKVQTVELSSLETEQKGEI
ncbi:MAG: pepsin-like aspartyl protease [archaeon]|nr:pepsin-like aspartyl protease [archaeon]